MTDDGATRVGFSFSSQRCAVRDSVVAATEARWLSAAAPSFARGYAKGGDVIGIDL